MKEVTIFPGSLAGRICVPASKSMGHRTVICAGLSEGISTINNVGASQDIEATCEAMENFGASFEKRESSLKIMGSTALKLKNPGINCYESGSTLRFIIPIAALTDEPAAFYGKGRLIERTLVPYYNIFEEQGIKYDTDGGKLPLHINGKLAPGDFKIAGNVSSQFISGLMFALPLLNGDSSISVTGELESKPYVDMTIKVLDDFSIHIENCGYRTFKISGGQKYRATEYTLPGDFSQAAFWLTAGTLGSDVECSGLDMNSIQGDKSIIDIIGEMGGRIVADKDIVRAIPADTKGIAIDASQCPDLVPILAVLGALSRGRTVIAKAGRLRLKESDRLKAVSSELNKIGACIKEMRDGLVIDGRETLKGGKAESWNDHRIAMALAIAATRCEKPVTISNADCVKKSYPDFWEHYKALGGKIDERNMG